MPPELAEVRRWIEKAEHDLNTADVALAHRPSITDTAAFHVQQAVEKLFKAYLVWRAFDFEKVRDLEGLVDDCAKFDPDFLALKPDVAPLTGYAARFRYPGPQDPTVATVNAILKVAAKVRQFVLARVPLEVRPEA
jgi:HEPN domain-containing protein